MCRFEALRETIGSDEDMVEPGAPMFACHDSAVGKEVACASWLALFGQYHITVRLALALESIDPAALVPKEGWPELYTDYEEMIRDKGREE